MTTHITPAQAREAAMELLGCVDHTLPDDNAMKACGAFGRVSTFIQRYEQMEAALGDLTSTSAVYFARKDKFRDDERLMIVMATGDESDFTVAQFRRAAAATKGE